MMKLFLMTIQLTGLDTLSPYLFLPHSFSCMHTNNQLTTFEGFSQFSIDCENDSQLSILGSYFKMANRVTAMENFMASGLCNGTTMSATTWMQEFVAPDYSDEIEAMYDVSENNIFDVDCR